MSGNLYGILRARFPAARATCVIETPDGRRYSYAELEQTSARYAQVLQRHGIGPGERVIVQVEKSPENVFLYLACLRAGAILVPLNTAYKASEIAYFLADAEPKVAVAAPASTLAAVSGGPETLTLDAEGGGTLVEQAAACDADQQVAEAADDDIAALLYTSGTTGRPKGAMMSHRNLATNALTLHRMWGFRPGDVLLHALPIFHTHGLFVAINCVLANGTGMLFLPRFDADEVIRLLPRATVMMGVPTFYVRLLAAAGFDAALCRNMRLFISGSAPLLKETFEAFEARTGQAILERYGMTETGMNTTNPLDGERLAGSVGPPLDDVEVRVCDAEGKLLPSGEIGGLEVRGPNVFSGYWRQPDKTREEFRDDGFFRTGDLSVIDEQGYVAIVGRSKDMIISGGFNVYPKEVEALIDRIEGVAETAVVGVPHPDFGEGVLAVVTRAPGKGETPSAESIIETLKQDLAGYKVPKAVLFVDALPRNVMGKVEKNRLREQYGAQFADGR